MSIIHALNWLRTYLPVRCFVSMEFGHTMLSLKLEAATTKPSSE